MIWRRIIRALSVMVICLAVLVGCQSWRNSDVMAVPERDMQVLRLATYNVHYIILSRETGPWSVGDWDQRKGPLDQAVKALRADIIGFQEMESFARGNEGQVNLTLDYLLAQNPQYRAAAVGDPASFPSTQPIFYRADRLTLLDQGWFFFSDTPDVIYARTFNGSFPAFASWAQFRDTMTGAQFRVLNLHTDYASRSNRLQSIELVADRIAPWIAADETFFVIGDFNGRIGDRVTDILAEQGLRFAPIPGATFHFNRGLNLFGAIDHVAAYGDATLAGPPAVIRQKFDGEWPTDHYPVTADYSLR